MDMIIASSKTHIYSFGNNDFGKLGCGFIGEKEKIQFTTKINPSPQQLNGYDCIKNYHCIKNLDLFLKKEFNSYNKYNGEDISNLRKKIQKSIYQLINEKSKLMEVYLLKKMKINFMKIKKLNQKLYLMKILQILFQHLH
jgi:hypothetical protein